MSTVKTPCSRLVHRHFEFPDPEDPSNQGPGPRGGRWMTVGQIAAVVYDTEKPKLGQISRTAAQLRRLNEATGRPARLKHGSWKPYFVRRQPEATEGDK